MRVAAVSLLLVAGSASADDGSSRRVSVALDMFEYFPSVSVNATSQPREFGPSQQDTGIIEIDVAVPVRIQPWLRVMPVIGFTDQGFGFGAMYTTGQPDLGEINQPALVLGAGAQAFYRYGAWEGHADVQFHAPIALGTANTTFFANSGQYDGQLRGGEIITVTAGITRRLGPVGVFFDLGYAHSVVSARANAFGLDVGFGGLLVAGGLSLW
jgi:hypothetical protein